ncbi:hypothetical protein Lal_00043848 [Lupinus albus]|uniref:Uncharacterized protein n=1 Tax=Lupinus albus TaxID=3870 RepID=A0A6A5PCY3_LUPAL|nr:hypothetical protein Lalb_Chr15g0088391 [Lupinus albus]KAF1895203.1 hypothetical protein Lal_00043848 [Lupinus albus]
MLPRCERMENEKKKRKRAREEEGENKIVGSSFEENNNAKKRGFEINFMKGKDKVKEEEEEEGFWDDSGSNLAFGVFDFPWLKDGVISKPEDLEDFEDNFMSCLEHQDNTSSFKVSGIDFSNEYGLCETSEVSSMSHIPESKLVEDAWEKFDDSNGWELKTEDLDNCTWNHPL